MLHDHPRTQEPGWSSGRGSRGKTIVVGADPPEQPQRPRRRRKPRGAEAGAEAVRELVVLDSEQPLPEGEGGAEGADNEQELLAAHRLVGLRDDTSVAVCSGGRPKIG